MSNTRRIAFRSDTRSPDDIFKDDKGFTPREPGVITYAGDIKVDTAVCVTWRLEAAALFPLPTPYK